MIYRLIKFEYPSWKGVAIFYAVVLGCLFSATLFAHIGTSVTVVALLFLLGTRAVGRNTMFEAALPIPGRDIFCARLLANLLSIWPLFLAIITAIPFSRTETKAQTTAAVIEALLVITFGMIAVYSFRVEELKAPRWWKQIIGWIGMIAVSVLFIQIDFDPIPLFLTISAIGICVLACMALFWKTWNSTPQSFQRGPTEPALQRSRAGKISIPSLPWMPVLRTLFSSQVKALLILLLFFGASGIPFAGILFTWLYIVIVTSLVRRNDQWLLSLPISRQKLFLTIVFIPFLLFLTGTVAHLIAARQSARAGIVGCTTVAGISLLGVLASQIDLFARHRIRRLYVLLSTGIATLAFIYFLFRWFFHVTVGDKFRTPPIELWLDSVLPARLPLLLVTAFAVIGSLYWLAYAGFRRAEVLRRTHLLRLQ